MERELAFCQACHIRSCPTFPLLVEAVRGLYKDGSLELKWITHHEPLLAWESP